MMLIMTMMTIMVLMIMTMVMTMIIINSTSSTSSTAAAAATQLTILIQTTAGPTAINMRPVHSPSPVPKQPPPSIYPAKHVTALPPQSGHELTHARNDGIKQTGVCKPHNVVYAINSIWRVAHRRGAAYQLRALAGRQYILHHESPCYTRYVNQVRGGAGKGIECNSQRLGGEYIEVM